MNITFPPVDEEYIKAKVKQGYYSNITEVVRDAVRRHREQDTQRARFEAAIQKGIDDFEAGRVVEFTPTLMDEIWKEAKQSYRKNPKRKLDPDVTGE